MRSQIPFALFTLFAAALAGCGGESCDVADATRCGDAAAETCVDGAWEVTEACDAGQTCMRMDGMAGGEAHCM